MIGCGLLIPVYAIGGMGAGDVKMTMGFGSWIGAFYGMPEGLYIIWWAFCIGTIAGGFIAAGHDRRPRQVCARMCKTSGKSLATWPLRRQSAESPRQEANKRRSRWHRLPYGVPLCIGFVGYLLYLYSQ